MKASQGKAPFEIERYTEVCWMEKRKEGDIFSGRRSSTYKGEAGNEQGFRGRDEESWRVDGSRGKGWGSGPEAILPEALSAG